MSDSMLTKSQVAGRSMRHWLSMREQVRKCITDDFTAGKITEEICGGSLTDCDDKYIPLIEEQKRILVALELTRA